MLKFPKDRLQVDDATAEGFSAGLAEFGQQLTEQELAMLWAVMRSAMDPWSRSLLEPPADLTSEEIAELDRLSKGAGSPE